MFIQQRLTRRRQRRWLFFHWRTGTRFRWQEPTLQFRTAAISRWRWRLIFTFQTARRATQTDMHVRAMTKPRANFVQPLAIRSGIGTQLLLDGRIDEDARHVAVLRGQLDQRFNARLPLSLVNGF